MAFKLAGLNIARVSRTPLEGFVIVIVQNLNLLCYILLEKNHSMRLKYECVSM